VIILRRIIFITFLWLAVTQTIVIYRLGSLGDTIVALPCFTAVTRLFPEAHKVLLTNKPVSTKAAPIESILGAGTGFFDISIAYPVGTRSPRALFALWKQLRAIGSDTLVYLTPPRGKAAHIRDYLFFKSAGFKTIIGLPMADDLAKCRIDADGVEEREAVRMTRCLAPVHTIDLADPAYWDLRLNAAETAAGRAITAPLQGGPYIAINMGGKAAEKDWGVDNWTTLITRLSDDFGNHGLLFVGAAEDGPRADALSNHWPGPIVNACGKLSPRESGAAMSGAIAFAGHDSGPLHLASAMNVPCVALFGDFNRPAKWHPFGAHHRIIHNMAGVKAITVPEVETALRDLLTTAKSQEVA
jgi:heptosyltransferase III